MAKCKLCKINIPDGMEYCNDCQDKGNIKFNESYLDSLLNSVKNTTPSIESVYKKKSSLGNSPKSSEDVDLMSEISGDSNESERIINNIEVPDIQMEDSFDDVYKMDISDLEDFDTYNFEEDLNDIEDDINISDEELFGEDISHLFPHQEGTIVSGLSMEEAIVEDSSEISVMLPEKQSDEDTEQYEVTEASDIENELSASLDLLNTDSFTSKFDQTDVDTAISVDNRNRNLHPEEGSELPEEDSMDLDLDELLNSLGSSNLPMNEEEEPEELYQAFESKEIIEEENQVSNPIYTEKEASSGIETLEVEDDDFLSLLNQMSFDDPAIDDVRTINELLKNPSATKTIQNTSPSDVGEVFSDALKVVSSLKDYEEDEIPYVLPDQENKKGRKSSPKNKKSLKEKKSKKVIKEKTDISLWNRLFANVKNDNTAAEYEEEKRAKSVAAEPSRKSKEKGKKGSAEVVEDEEIFTGKKAPKEKATAKKAAKKEKAEKKKKSKEVIQVIDEIDADPGRINRLGAAIVFLFFGILAAVLILGAQLVSYSLSIEHATTYFGNRKYTQAYNEVYGVDIKDEDILIYDKIMTVMYVNKQLNSYNSYYAMKMYPEALDSLLKGLSRYDKYIELATYLGIKSDLDYVRTLLLAELSNIYHLSEEEAVAIINTQSKEEYSLTVYDVVQKLNY